MKVINLSLDPHLFDPDSVASARARSYGTIVDEYTIVVPTPGVVCVELSGNVSTHGAGGKSKVAQLWRMYKLLSSLIASGRCDVITAQDPYFLGLLGLFLARRHHKGLEIQILGLEKLTPLRKVIARYVLRRASVIRALSTRMRGRLIDEFGINPNMIRVVSIYVDVEKLGLDVRTLGPKESREFNTLSTGFREEYGKYFNFLTVSRLVSIKDIPLQLSALERLITKHRTVRLHIVGTGPEEAALKNEVRNRKLSEYVIFHGAQYGHKLGVFYLESDCFLLTSRYEGWGMVIIEAMSAGLPVIMTNVGCAGEVVVNEKSGLVVPVKDLDALTRAMERIIADNSFRSMLSEGAAQSLKALPTLPEILRTFRESWEVANRSRL